MSHVASYQNLYDLIIKNKVYQTCNVNLLAFLQERDPSTHIELTKLGDQYYSAHPNVRVQKVTPFLAFACEATSEVSRKKLLMRMRHSHLPEINHLIRPVHGNVDKGNTQTNFHPGFQL